jgi:hypothetical protein
MQDVKLPAQVQEMSDQADNLIKEIGESDKTEKKAVEETRKIEVKPTVKEPEDRKPPVKTETEDWKHKYNVLQGKYNQEIKPLQDDVSLLTSLKSQVRVLTQQLNEGDAYNRELRAKLDEKKSPPPTPKKVEMPESVMSLLSDEDSSYLEEEAIEPKTMEIIGKLITKVLSINKPDNSQSIDVEEIKRDANTIRNTAEKTFRDKIEAGVSDVKVINESESFRAWIFELIPHTNITWNDSLQTAQDERDSQQVINIFNEFKRLHPPQAKPQSLQINPEKHIVPTSTVGSGEPTAKPKGRTYTRQEITAFYNDAAMVAAGNSSKYTKEEVKLIDADIIKAAGEQGQPRITN